MKLLGISLLIIAAFISATAQPVWQSGFKSRIRFYQTTDFGILIVGTDRSLSAVGGMTGERIWVRKNKRLKQTSIIPVPGTDLILLTRDKGKKSRIEAVDLLSGHSVWSSEKVNGDVLQLAVDPEMNLLAVTIVKDAKGNRGEEINREPVIYAFRLSDGTKLWKEELESEVALMPSRFDKDGEIEFTLDNYRPPLFLDGRLYLFYEGVTSYRAADGKDKRRDEFGVNEGGLALTDADPVFDSRNLYFSGRGKVRAVNRRTGETAWKAKDLGVTPEMALVGNVLYVRTGGQFTRIKDGEVKKRGPFGVSAIDTRTGKRLWRYKGADKGLTNFVFADRNTILIADRDDLIALDAGTGKRLRKSEHRVKKARFVVLNERGEAVVGGRDTLSAFRVSDLRSGKGPLSPVWTVRHKAPARGVFRIMAGIALRATALYFRYGGLANSAFSVFRGAGFARSALSFRWSGLRSRFSTLDLSTLASNRGGSYFGGRIHIFGIAARNPNFLSRIAGLRVITPNSAGFRGRLIGSAVRRAAPSRSAVQESLLDRLDPVRRIEKLSDYFLRRKRLAEFRGDHMYFFTDLPDPFGRKGLAGVNIHTGIDSRFVLVSNPDTQFVVDEPSGLLYSAKGKRLRAFDILKNK